MLGRLPTKLKVGQREYEIRTDFRDILRIIMAYNDKNLTDQEKVYVCLSVIYKALDRIPKPEYQEALKAAMEFIECRLSNDKPSPKVIAWEKDEQIMFPAINKAAGCEVRQLPYAHWWTFLGWFQAIDRDDLWGTVLTIRQKKASGKKLEKYEKEFLNANRELCAMQTNDDKVTPEDQMKAMFNELLKKGGDGNG